MPCWSLNLSPPSWEATISPSGERLLLKGRVYLDGRPIGATELEAHLGPTRTPEELAAALQRLNGFYAWVTLSNRGLRAGVDHIRSRPLFYGQGGDKLYLADDAEWVRQQVGDHEMEPIAREEFLLAGYVTGRDTLFPNVKQLQAGECLAATLTDKGPVVTPQRYYRFLHTEPALYTEAHLRDQLDQAAVTVMTRLIDYANGRQIVVPLSGGYDSRLIVTLLKRLGYKNVLAFSYGVAGNEEAACSRDVAEALEIPWKFIEYTNSVLAQAWSTGEARVYRAMAANHASLPHVQDWFALKILLEARHIDSDAVLVPGHTGDFISGGHIPSFVFERKTFSLDDLLGRLTNGHLVNVPGVGFEINKDGALERRLWDRISYPFDGTDISIANLVELWDWQERQAKYIVNSVRVYDHFHLDWWLPLWDIDFVRFWEGVPLELRKRRKWFIDWIDAQYLATGGRPLMTNTVATTKKPQIMMDRVRNQVRVFLPQPLAEQLRPIRWRWNSSRNYDIHEQHFLAFAGLVPRHLLKDYLARGYNIIGIFSDLYIKDEWDTVPGW